MQFLRQFGMLLVNHRAFAIAGMSLVEARPDGWRFVTVTGIPFMLDQIEADICKQEILQSRGNIIPISTAKYDSPLNCFRAFNWIVLPYRAFNAQAITAIEIREGTLPTAHYRLTFMNNLQVDLNPQETKFFDRECQNIIYETQRVVNQMR